MKAKRKSKRAKPAPTGAPPATNRRVRYLPLERDLEREGAEPRFHTRDTLHLPTKPRNGKPAKRSARR